ncbi:MAG: PIG-L deacetylase family protein [Bacillota bacterium]
MIGNSQLLARIESLFRQGLPVYFFGYRSSDNFRPQLYVQLEEKHLRQKIAALKHYRSQTTGKQSAGYYFQARVIRAWALFRGTHGVMRYAEAFEVYCMRIVGGESENG